MELIVATTDITFDCVTFFKGISTHPPRGMGDGGWGMRYNTAETNKHIQMELNRISLNFIVDFLSVISYTFDS